MKAQLMLERIGDDQEALIRSIVGRGIRSPWVAKIVGEHPRFGLDREFLSFHKDFVEANGNGSRGVRAVYILESGYLYEVKELLSWSKSRRFFCEVSDTGEIVEVPNEEALTRFYHHEVDRFIAKQKADGH